MKYLSLCGLLLVALPLAADPIQHDFLAIDEGLGNLMRVDQQNPVKSWLIHIGKNHPRDMQLIGSNRVLIGHDQGYCIYDIKTGGLLKDISLYHDVSSARGLPNGDIILAGVDFDGPKLNKGDDPVGDPAGRHVLFVEYDADNHQIKRVTYVGDYLRIVRQTAAGTFICSCNTVFREGDGNGNWIREFPITGLNHACWQGIRLPNGNTLMSAGFGTSLSDKEHGSSFIAEADPNGKEVRRFGTAAEVPARVHPYFYGLFQLLENGDVVAANWQGHNAGHNNSGVQILEFDPHGAIVWEWSDRAFVSSIQAVLVLDGIDSKVLNDERNGTIRPVK